MVVFSFSPVCCRSSSGAVFRLTRRDAASRRAETDVHGERSKRRRDGRRRGELTGSQQVTASPSFYYLLSLSRSSGYPLSFPPPPSTMIIWLPLHLSRSFRSILARIFPSPLDRTASRMACLSDEQLKGRFSPVNSTMHPGVARGIIRFRHSSGGTRQAVRRSHSIQARYFARITIAITLRNFNQSVYCKHSNCVKLGFDNYF